MKKKVLLVLGKLKRKLYGLRKSSNERFDVLRESELLKEAGYTQEEISELLFIRCFSDSLTRSGK